MKNRVYFSNMSSRKRNTAEGPIFFFSNQMIHSFWSSVYSNFATNGAHADDYIVARIVNHDGEVIYEREPEITQVADPALFAAARRPLEVVPTGSGTAARANIGRARRSVLAIRNDFSTCQSSW